MRIINDLLVLLAAACRVGSASFVSAVIKTLKQICLMAGLLGAAVVLLLGAMGLMIAALFIGLAPHLGAHWAAMIAAGASLAGSAILLLCARRVCNNR